MKECGLGPLMASMVRCKMEPVSEKVAKVFIER